MNMLTLPRAAAAFEYKALRYPAQLFETHVVAQLLAEESQVRLAFERLLGTLDSTAGSLFADEALTRRGQALTRRADVVEKAASLEDAARTRAQQAKTELREGTEQAREERRQATADQVRTAQQVREDEQAEKQAAARRAQAREQAAAEAIRSRTDAKVSAERERLEEQEKHIAQVKQGRTAGARAQLSTAVDDSRSAQQKKDDADRLAGLADAERAARKA